MEKISSFSDVFGVRFFPGVHPGFLSVTMKELYNRQQRMEPFLKGDKSWLKDMSQEMDFYQRIRIFMEVYEEAEKEKKLLWVKKL